jgi:hypothetical protein
VETASLAGGNITEDILFRRNKEKTAKLQGMTFAYFLLFFYVCHTGGLVESGTFHANLCLNDFIQLCVYKLGRIYPRGSVTLHTSFLSKHNKSQKSTIFLF